MNKHARSQLFKYLFGPVHPIFMSDTAFLDDYAPFENEPRAAPAVARPVAPVFRDPGVDDECPLTPEQLDAYEREVHLLELSVNNREQQVHEARQTGGLEPAPNWPKCYPIVHFDIEDVSEQYRHFVHEAFFTWIMMAVSFLLNWIGCLTLISVSDDAIGSPGSKIALSSLYLFVVCPLALDLDAMSVYRALSAPSVLTISYLKIFLALAFTIAFEGMMVLGLDDSGSVGLISTIDLFSYGHTGVGVWGVIVTLVFGVALVFHVKLITGLWKFYKGTEEGEHMETDVRRSVAEFMVERLRR